MIFAERTLTYQSDRGNVDVPVRVHAPRRQTDDFSSLIEIEYPDRTYRLDVFGADGLQALTLALQTIAAHLYASEYHAVGKLFWVKPENGYGFPLASTLRDKAIGYDREFF